MSESSCDGAAEIQVFSNFALTAEIGHAPTTDLVTSDMAQYELEKGTYYIRTYRRNGYAMPYKISTGLGFIPKSGKVKESGKKSDAKFNASEVKVNIFNKEEDLKTYICNVGEYTSNDLFVQKWNGYGEVHKFTVDKDGWFCSNYKILI